MREYTTLTREAVDVVEGAAQYMSITLTEYAEEASSKKATSSSSSSSGSSSSGTKKAAGVATYKELGISSSAASIGASSSDKAARKPNNTQLTK